MHIVEFLLSCPKVDTSVFGVSGQKLIVITPCFTILIHWLSVSDSYYHCCEDGEVGLCKCTGAEVGRKGRLTLCHAVSKRRCSLVTVL